MKTKRKRLIIICFAIGLWCLYYYCPRKVSFELETKILKPNKEFDFSYLNSFFYVENQERLYFFLVDYYKTPPCVRDGLKGYDSLFVENLNKTLDFNKYDYLIVFQKRLLELNFSPYLAKTEDLLDYVPKKPLISTFDTIITDSIYIYRIKKNNKYRAPGP